MDGEVGKKKIEPNLPIAFYLRQWKPKPQSFALGRLAVDFAKVGGMLAGFALPPSVPSERGQS